MMRGRIYSEREVVTRRMVINGPSPFRQLADGTWVDESGKPCRLLTLSKLTSKSGSEEKIERWKDNGWVPTEGDGSEG